MKTLNETTKELNAYQITWTILSPIKGKITKKDFKVIGSEMRHFASKEKAISFASNIKGLSKNFQVLFITDKQFGMMDGTIIREGKYFEAAKQVATKEQLKHIIFI